MKAQWKIVDTETGLAITVGKEIELVDACVHFFDGSTSMSWFEATQFFGDPASASVGSPMGILKCKS